MPMASNPLVVSLSSFKPFFFKGLQSGGTLLGLWWSIRPRNPIRAPPEIEWFANLTNVNTRRAYQQDLADFMAFAGLRQPAQFRDVTRTHVIAWREQLVGQGLANDTIRRKLAALSSLYAYL